LETAETGLPYEAVQSLCEDARGVVWATTQNGLLVSRAGGGWNTVSTNANWPGGRATSVTADKSGAGWIGTRDYALHRWENGKFTTWKVADGLVSHNIHTLLAGANGDLWIGGNAPDCLQRLHDGHLLTVSIPADIRTIRTMTEDRSGNI